MNLDVDPARAARQLLRDRGAETLDHPGGTLLAHLERVRHQLARWNARPALQLAVNQGVVLVLAVVVVGGLVGGGALGYDVVKGLSRGEMGIGMTAGVAIVCLGLVLDRITQPGSRKQSH